MSKEDETVENTINESEKKKRFKLKMPGAFMILFILNGCRSYSNMGYSCWCIF